MTEIKRATFCTAGMSEDYKGAFGGDSNIKIFPLKPSEKYGKFFYVGSEKYTPQINSNLPQNESQTWLGFQKPKSKEEARKLYHLKPPNMMEWIHTVVIEVPDECIDAVVFIGPVEGGSGIQLNMNDPATKCAKSLQIEKLV